MLLATPSQAAHDDEPVVVPVVAQRKKPYFGSADEPVGTAGGVQIVSPGLGCLCGLCNADEDSLTSKNVGRTSRVSAQQCLEQCLVYAERSKMAAGLWFPLFSLGSGPSFLLLYLLLR